MPAASARGSTKRLQIGLRLCGCAAAICFLAAPTAKTISEDAGVTAASKALDAARGAAAPALHPVGPVVVPARRHEPSQPAVTNQPVVTPPKQAASAIASDSDPVPPAAGKETPADAKTPPPEPKPKAKPPIIEAHEYGRGPSPLTESAENKGTAPLSSKPPIIDARDSQPATKPAMQPDPTPDLAFQGTEDLPPLPALEIEPPSFKGLTPGVSTVDDLLKLWGDAAATSGKEDAARWTYKIEPYRRVEVTMSGKKVASIAVLLEKPFEPEGLVKQLHMDGLVPVPVLDEAGRPLGESIPERGVLLSFAPEAKLVTQMLLEPIDAEPFVTRAAANADVEVRRSLRDLDYALQLDPKSARPHWLRSQLLARHGRYEDALKSIDEALKIDAKRPSYRLSRSEILGHLDRHAEAIPIAKEVLAETELPPLVKSQAFNVLGDLVAEGPDHDYQQAIELHLSAIKAAQPLAADRQGEIRREAKRIMLEAHLGAACDIAFGVWQQKEQMAARWLNRADELAKDLIQAEQADPQLRLHVARRALDVRVGVQGKWDSSDWTARVIEDGQRLIEAADDPLRRERLEWEIGLALFDIGEIDQLGGLSDHSLTDSTLDLKYLGEGVKHRQQTAEDVYLAGRLLAHIGMIQAKREKNHAAAIAWFDKATPLLDRPLPPTAVANLGRHGETFIAMGISYWANGQRDEAVQLTEKGVDLMAKAVAVQQLDERSLAIPYSNLAAMHREMGHTDEARSFAETASRYDGTKRR